MKYILYGFLTCFLLLNSFTTFAQTKKDNEKDVFKESVTNLPPIDKIEILAVKWLNSVKREEIDCTKPDIVCSQFPARILASKTIVGDDAKKLSNLWRNLKNGNGAGCFAPAYVLRFYQKDKIILTTDVCFHCCNITLPESGIRSVCGNETAIIAFEDFVTTQVPFPEQKQEN